MTPQQELELADKARKGDREALSLLWDELTPKLFGYLVNVTRNKTLAEDLLQSTWMKAIAALPNFQSRGVRLSAWLFAIARNECRLHWRESNREEALDETKHDCAVDGRKAADDSLAVEQALSRLPEGDREILRLRYIADLSVADLAQVLNINSIAARVRLHRAVSRARAMHASNS